MNRNMVRGRWFGRRFGGLRAAAPALALGLLVLGCGGYRTQKQRDFTGRKVRIVTTIGMIADAAKNIGGEHVSVTALMGPGVDPHLYKATEGDVMRMASADLILYGGLHLEGKMVDVLAKMNDWVPTVAVAEAIPEDSLLALPGGRGFHDPHVWFDVVLWERAVERTYEALAGLDTLHAAVYRANHLVYRRRLDSLDVYIRRQVSRVPEDRRVLITSHDAFHYFGRRYGVEVRGLQGVSTAVEAGTADVQELAKFIARRRLPAIFIESSMPVRTIEAVREAVRARGFEVRIGGELFSDAMGDEGTFEGTYPGMVTHNVDTFVRAMIGGDAPPEGGEGTP